MTRQSRLSGRIASIVGGALVGLGLHILFANLDRAAAQLRQLLGPAAGESLGILPSVVLAASRAGHAYAVDQQGFLHVLLDMAVSFWPLLLVIAGTILLRDIFTDKVKAEPASTKYFQNRDTGCRFRCPSFEA